MNDFVLRLSAEEVSVLVEFADEGERPGGCTAYGPKFNAVMQVALDVRQRSKVQIEPDLWRSGLSPRALVLIGQAHEALCGDHGLNPELAGKAEDALFELIRREVGL